MRSPSSRRRLRLRRKRKDERFSSKLSTSGHVGKSRDSGSGFDVTDAADAVEVVGHFGCCVVEAIGAAAVLFALLSVPAYLLLTKVT